MVVGLVLGMHLYFVFGVFEFDDPRQLVMLYLVCGLLIGSFALALPFTST